MAFVPVEESGSNAYYGAEPPTCRACGYVCWDLIAGLCPDCRGY